MGLEGDDGVEEAGLISEADRAGGIEGGAGDDAAEGLEVSGSGGEGRGWGAGMAGEVCAHSDVGRRHVFKSTRPGNVANSIAFQGTMLG
jgi:hypothetical protein